MKAFIFASLAALVVASPPWKINNNGTISCRKLGNFCAGDSDKTNIIIHCNEKGSSGNYAGNCNDNLAGVCGGVCEYAPCRACHGPNKGDAFCSADGAIAPNGTQLSDPAEKCKKKRGFLSLDFEA